MQKIFKYTNGEVTVIWQPEICRHTGICFKGLPLVFDPRRKPWIDPLAADTEAIISQINKCPSHALSFHYNADQEDL